MSVAPELASTTFVGRSLALPVYVRQDRAYMNTTVNQPRAPGLSTLHTVTGGQIELPQQVTLTWITSAVVANRFVGMQFKDQSGNVVGQTYMNGPQVASTTYNYTFMLDAGAAFVAGNFGIAPLPFMLLYEQWSWHIVVINADSGDQEDGLTHTDLILPTGPPDTAPSTTVTAVPALA